VERVLEWKRRRGSRATSVQDVTTEGNWTKTTNNFLCDNGLKCKNRKKNRDKFLTAHSRIFLFR
jgi:hypothetical protein